MQFAFCRMFGTFTGFELTAGELPEVVEMAAPAFGQQHPVVVNENGGGDFYGLT